MKNPPAPVIIRRPRAGLWKWAAAAAVAALTVFYSHSDLSKKYIPRSSSAIATTPAAIVDSFSGAGQAKRIQDLEAALAEKDRHIESLQSGLDGGNSGGDDPELQKLFSEYERLADDNTRLANLSQRLETRVASLTAAQEADAQQLQATQDRYNAAERIYVQKIDETNTLLAQADQKAQELGVQVINLTERNQTIEAKAAESQTLAENLRVRLEELLRQYSNLEGIKTALQEQLDKYRQQQDEENRARRYGERINFIFSADIFALIPPRLSYAVVTEVEKGKYQYGEIIEIQHMPQRGNDFTDTHQEALQFAKTIAQAYERKDVPNDSWETLVRLVGGDTATGMELEGITEQVTDFDRMAHYLYALRQAEGGPIFYENSSGGIVAVGTPEQLRAAARGD